jgi:uncharacterized OB-fold protein
MATNVAAAQVDRPLPVIDDDSRPFWESCRAHAMKLQRCRRCGRVRYYPSAICDGCSSFDFDWLPMSGRGTIYTFTVMHRPALPAFASEVPYVYAVVELEEGPMMPTNIVNAAADEVRIGMHVEVVYDDVSPEVTLPKFQPRVALLQSESPMVAVEQRQGNE